MTITEERADRIFKALGALEAGLHAMEKAKTDRIESGVIVAKYESLEKDKADRVELLHLHDAIMKDLRDTVADLAERMGDKFNATNSQILDLRDRLAALGDRLDAMSRKDDKRGAEIARLGDVLESLAKVISDQAEEAAADKRNRWRKWRRRMHVTAQYAFQAVAGLAILTIFAREGLTGLPAALDLFRRVGGF